MVKTQWPTYSLLDLCNVYIGLTHTPRYVDHGIPFLSAKDLNKGKLDFSDAKQISKEEFSIISNASKPQKGDIVFGRVGTLGNPCIVEKQTDFAIFVSLGYMRPKPGVMGAYLCQWMRSDFFMKQVEEKIAGSSQKNLNTGWLREFSLLLPSVKEQQQIVGILSDIDDTISLYESLLSKKRLVKQGAMQELLTGKKRLSGFSGEWQTFIFGELFDFIPNNAFTRAQMSESGKVKNIHYGDILTKYGAYVDGNSNAIPYISREVDLSRFADRCYLQSGDIIIADTAEDEAVGKALEVVNVNCPILAGQHTLMCRPKIKFADKFLGYYLNAACYHDQLLPYIVGTKVSSVSKASVAQTKLVVPEYKEQQAIAEILSNMDSEIEALEKELAKYRQVKQGMMQQLLTGKIRLV